MACFYLLLADQRSNKTEKRQYQRVSSVNAGVAQLVELQPSKLNVASSSLVSRSIDIKHRFSLACHTIFLFVAALKAHVAQSVERFLGKEEVHRFNSDRGLHFSH